jgi:hypothetical protein
VTQHVYPNPKTRTPIKGHYYFPNKVRRLYRETLAALSNEAPTLAAAGLRGIVEATCLDQGIKKGDLKDKINALGLPAKQAELLHLQRYLGNLAVHELQKPEEEEVLAGLEIVEILLATLYILPETADKMKRSRAEAAQKQKAQSQSGPAKP